MSIESIQLPLSQGETSLIETPEKGKGWEKATVLGPIGGGGGGEPGRTDPFGGKGRIAKMRVYTSSKPKKPRKKKHHSAHDTSAQSLIAQNQKLAVELDDLSYKYEKAKRHERDLRDLREGIEVLESGLRSRSEESMACLGKVDCALQAIEDRVLGSTEAGEGGEDRLADFRHLVPQMRQDLAELRVKVNFGSGAQPPTPERPSTTELEGRSFAGAVSPDTAESPSSSTEKLLNEYQSALAKTQAEARGLRAKLNSCLGEKSALQQEVEKAFERLVRLFASFVLTSPRE